MMATLLTEKVRRAAHGLHRCGWCGDKIAAGERYNDQRIADNGTVYTWREHRGCAARFWKAWRAEGLHEDDLEGVHPREAFNEMCGRAAAAVEGREPT